MMKFSILAAQYNNGRYFSDFYNSIIAQTSKDWEVIIVDDCSTDNSVELMRTIIKGDTRFHLYINDQNKGCGYTKRRCAELATGDICGFVDPDDALTPDAIELMLATHRKYPEVSLVHSTFFYCDENLVNGEIGNLGRDVNVDAYFTNLGWPVTHFTSFRRDRYEQTSGIDSRLKRAVDQDLILKLSETGPFKYVDKPLYRYRIHSNGISTLNNGVKAFYYFLKVISYAEDRRGVSLEEEVEPYLNGQAHYMFYESKLANAKFLFKQLTTLLRKRPLYYLKRLFRG